MREEGKSGEINVILGGVSDVVALWRDDRPLSALRNIREMFGGVILDAASGVPASAKSRDRSCIMSICEIYSVSTHKYEENRVRTQIRLAGRLGCVATSSERAVL